MENWYTQQMRQSAEFEKKIVSLWAGLPLYRAYSLQEITYACQRVCSHYPHPSDVTMGVLLIGDMTVVRDFIQELANENRTDK